MEWMNDGRKVLAAAIVFGVVVLAWLFRYEQLNTFYHKNRLTGAICRSENSCWLTSSDWK